MATWVIQSNKIKTSQTLLLIEALSRLGEPFVDVAVDTETGLLTEVPEELGTDLIPYGSTYLVKVAQQLGWRHLFFDEEKFNVAAWLKNRPDMLNADAKISTIAAVRRDIGPLLMMHPVDLFIRPTRDLKDFAGHVIKTDEFARWADRLAVGDCEFDDTLEIAVSVVKPIQMEWRYFIVDGQIVTGSVYRHGGQPLRQRELDGEVLAEAQTMADIWLPHPCCCMDLALCGGELRVVEFNGLNASGFYDHDVEAFAKAVSAYCRL